MTPRVEERTEVLYGIENTIQKTLEDFPLIRERLNSCIDKLGPSIVITTEPIRNALIELKERGIEIKYITEIIEDNIHYCKELAGIVSEMRHLAGVKGNFGVTEFSYIGSATNREGTPLQQLIVSTVKAFVEQQQYFFDMLWSKSIPAAQRIMEIEEGIAPAFIETIHDPTEILNIAYKLVRSAKDEINIIFHTTNALLRQEKAGGVDLLIENAVKYKTRVKILVPIEDKLTNVVQRLEKVNEISVLNIEPTMQTRMTILIVDRMYSLVVELKDDTKYNPGEAIGLATYSNSKSTVLSYVSIFDTLWKQSELHEESVVRSMAQKEFINIAAHELRNPIQPILGLSDVLLRSDIFMDSNKINGIKQKEIVEIIARNAKRLQHLTEDILDVTKIDSKTLKLNKHSFVLGEPIKEIVQDYSTEIRNKDKGIILSFFGSEELKFNPIIADENRIKQVLCNLIDNAIKFTLKGEITITSEIDDKHNQVIVKVKDTGTGIDSGILPKLFNKFVTKSDSGTGLGLYICKGIIEAHHGRIWAENNSGGNHGIDGDRVDNEMGNGATFCFSLPLIQS